MGRGIAQIAAQAGSTVYLMDVQPGAAEKARDAIALQWDKRVAKSALTPDAAAAHKARLTIAQSLEDLAGCDLVIEAIAEKLDAKKALFTALEAIVREDPFNREQIARYEIVEFVPSLTDARLAEFKEA